MNFLAPLFLLGALAIAAPVVFHLIRRTTREKIRFSSLLFLQPDPPRLTQRSRIEHWLLLLLRAGALALLALAFARPFIRTDSPLTPDAGPSRRQVILVDTSASMTRAGLESAARTKAGELLHAAKPGDQMALWAFDSTVHRLMDFTEWTALPVDNRAGTAATRLEGIKPAWGSTGLAAALTQAAEFLAEVPPGQEFLRGGEILLVSDLQEGSRLEGLQGWDWPQEIQVTSIPLVPQHPGNAGLQLAPDTAILVPGEEPRARVRVWNSSDSTAEQFQVGWAPTGTDTFIGTAQDVIVPPGQSRVVALPWRSADILSAPEQRLPSAAVAPLPNSTNSPPPTPDRPAGVSGTSTLHSRRILLKGDAEPFDNSLFATPPTRTEVTAWYFGTDSLTDSKKPPFFLKQALPDSRQVRVMLNPVPPQAPLPVILPGQPVLFFADGEIPPSQAAFLHGQLQSGRTVLLALTDAAAGPSLAAMAGAGPETLRMEDVKPATYAMLGEISFQHPLFAPFADPRFSDFTKIRFWKYTRWNPDALPGSRVLAKFDAGDPALVEVPVGQGRLVVLASGWHPEASQLALSSKFVPLLASLLEWSGAVISAPAQFVSGQPVALQLLGLTGAGPVAVKQPDGTTSTVPAESAVFTATGQPGLYTATAGTLTKTFAVNLAPAESRTTPLAADDLDRMGVPVKGAGAGTAAKPNKGPDPAVQTESRQKLWRWIIAAALAVLLTETLLAGLSARRTPASGGSAV